MKTAKSRAVLLMCGIVFQELRYVLPQFFSIKYPLRSPFRILVLVLTSVFRLFLGKSAKLSFAFTGEDRIIEGILNSRIKYRGFYVEVGANHPVFLSNTYALYRRGWRGICIDANEKLISKYGYLRPKDIAVCAMVSNDLNPKKFYFIENDVLSSVDVNNANKAKEEGLFVKEVSLNPTNLTNILDENHAPSSIDILSIDVEEHDFEVLKSLDLDRYSPRLIILELESFNLLEASKDKVVNYLDGFGYHLVGYVLKNAYFVKHNESK